MAREQDLALVGQAALADLCVWSSGVGVVHGVRAVSVGPHMGACVTADSWRGGDLARLASGGTAASAAAAVCPHDDCPPHQPARCIAGTLPTQR
jgi:hypothetical protein